MATTEVEEFVEENNNLEIIKDENGKDKVRCRLTGHQLPCRLSDIITYTSGKRYQRLVSSLSQESQEKEFLVEDYKNYLEPSKKNKNQLYCKVTRKLINNIPHHIQKHVTGKRFQRQLKIYKETSESGDGEEDFWKPPESDSDEQEVDRLSDSFMDDEDFDDDDDEKIDESFENENNTKMEKKKAILVKEKGSSKENESKEPIRKRKATDNIEASSTEITKRKSNKQSRRSKITKK